MSLRLSVRFTSANLRVFLALPISDGCVAAARGLPVLCSSDDRGHRIYDVGVEGMHLSDAALA